MIVLHVQVMSRRYSVHTKIGKSAGHRCLTPVLLSSRTPCAYSRPLT